MIDKENLAKLVKNRVFDGLKRRGFNRNECSLSHLTGVEIDLCDIILKGEAEIDLELIFKLCKGFRVQPGYFLDKFHETSFNSEDMIFCQEPGASEDVWPVYIPGHSDEAAIPWQANWFHARSNKNLGFGIDAGDLILCFALPNKRPNEKQELLSLEIGGIYLFHDKNDFQAFQCIKLGHHKAYFSNFDGSQNNTPQMEVLATDILNKVGPGSIKKKGLVGQVRMIQKTVLTRPVLPHLKLAPNPQ